MQLRNNSFLLIITFLFLYTNCEAQISRAGTPKSYRLGLTNDLIEEVSLPSVDVNALVLEDIDRAQSNLPYRFAKGFPVNYNLANSGTWTELSNGDRIWRLQITCKDALSVNFLYDDFFMPAGATLFIYSQDLTEVIGAFGAHNNRPNRKFATGLVNSTSVILEYYEPAVVTGQGALSINQIAHGYRDFLGVNGIPEGLGDAGSCQVNINCSPEGDDWQVEKKAVARIIINGIETCTGSLINNIAQDCTPYFLTANHCIDPTYDAVTNPDISGSVFYWNYERPDCDNTGAVPIETTAGATVIANSNPPGGNGTASDFALFELTEDPSDVYDVWVAGFDASGDSGTGGVGIHHPGLDAKKIATHSITPTIVVNDNYWRIYWDETDNGWSVTEGGSSGSGLWNSDKRLIGQLFGGFLGGQPNCNDPANDEGDYGRISVSWEGITGNTDPKRRLKDWLDPNDTGDLVVDGTSCLIPDYVLAIDPSTGSNCGSNTVVYTVDVISQNGYTDPVDLSVTALPTGTSASFATNPVTPGNTSVLTISGINNLADGSYDFTLEGSSTSGDKTLLVGLDVADQAAAILDEPLDGSVDVSTFPLLTWESDIGVLSYEVEVSTDPTFTNIVASTNVINNSCTVTPVLDILTEHHWRVRHIRSCGVDPWSASFSFTTSDANPGTCGNPIEMICGDTYSGNNSTGENNFEVHDPGGASSWSGPELIFEVEVAAGLIEATMTGLSADLDLYLITDCNDPANSELDESENGGSSSETVSATVGDGTFYIMVDGYNGATSDFDLLIECTSPVDCDPLTLLTLLTPADGAVDQSVSPSLTWSVEPLAVSYDVEVASDINFNNIVASANVTNEDWVVTPDLLENTEYYWRTRVVQACGSDPWPSPFSFTTAAPVSGCLLTEDFESGLPGTWAFSVNGTNAQWSFDTHVLPGQVSNPGTGNWATYDDLLTGQTGQNNVALAVSPTTDMSAYENIELSFDYAYVDDPLTQEFVIMSITDGVGTYYWDGNAWTGASTNWLENTTVANGFFLEAIPLDLMPDALSVTFEYNDGNAASRGGLGFDNFELCGDLLPPCTVNSANLANITCNDNNTSSQSDDYFTFDLDPSGTDIGATYSISGDYNQSGIDYGAPINIDNGGAGFLISNGDLSLSIIDDEDPNCSLAFSVAAPGTCSEVDPCTNTLILTGTESGVADNEAIWIESTQHILPGASVDYDATDFITLEAGFTVDVGAILEVFIDGCNNGSGGSNFQNNDDEENK